MSKSTWAAAAAAIRTELKKHGIKGKVTSESYSGGSSVRVKVEDQTPATMAKIESFAKQFQQGHFNSMEDIYEYSNSNDDIPQVRFVFVDNLYSVEMYQAAWDYLRNNFADFTDKPEVFDHKLAWDYDTNRTLMDTLRLDKEFWLTQKPKVKAA